MKKLLVLVALIAMSAVAVNAQPRAIGGSFGGRGFEASYQHSLGEKNMLEVEVGLPGLFWKRYGAEVAATYDWIFPFTSWEQKGRWNWYAGVGAAVGGDGYNGFFAGIAGRIGVEYNFWFPLNLSIDYRPVIGGRTNNQSTFGNFYDGGLYGASLSVRYLFNQ